MTGVAWDWLRMWWDMHTYATDPPTMAEIVDLIQLGTPWWNECAYDFLEDAAFDASTPSNVETAFYNSASGNGIDHTFSGAPCD
jgi:hypothetical protein